jgi:heme-degrading monooxygenase HmoA
MFVRVGSFAVKPGCSEDLRQTYGARVVPLVTAQPGCVGCMLLEPAGPEEPFLVLTLWETRAACEAYEASGAAREAVSAVKHLFAGPPTLSTYESQRFALREAP